MKTIDEYDLWMITETIKQDVKKIRSYFEDPYMDVQDVEECLEDIEFYINALCSELELKDFTDPAQKTFEL